MCGIAGIFTNRPLTGQEITQCTSQLRHRGPDAFGSYITQNDHFGLIHTRLSIIDLSSAANQPFHSADGRYIMVYNGEVYNHRDLANKHALSLKTGSDTEVIIELFARLGPSFVSELNGMFALAIYDTLDEKVFLFRDRLGIKPMYYTIDEGSLVFASELPTILAALPPTSPNTDALATYLHRGYIPEPLTAYQGIYKFPAGSWAEFKDGQIKTHIFWKAADHIRGDVESNEFKIIGEVHERLRESVRLRLMADVPFGAFLSGGADSGLISAIAVEINPGPVNTFNVGFENAAFDETPYAKAMATHIGAQHHHITVSKKEVMESLKEGLSLVGEPFADSSIFPTSAVSKFASQHVKMALSGDGGDELFMGYGAYNWAERFSKPRVATLGRLIAATLRLKGDGRSRRAANVFDFRNRDNIHAHIFSQEQNLFSAKEIEAMTGAAFTDPFNPDIFKSLPRKLTPAEEQAFFDLTNYLKDDLLVKVDRASMRHGLEVRVPFLDHTLVEYAINIDPAIKTKNGEAKYPIKKILEKYYPNELIYRKKWGFSIPLESWLTDAPEFFDHTNLPAQYKAAYGNNLKAYRTYKNRSFLYNRVYALKALSPYI